MIDYFVRFVKRFAVLVPGIVIAYISIHTIFPAFDKRFPVAIAILFTYVVGAYLLIPLLIRLARIFFPARHLPLYCVTPDGFASDPLNIGILANQVDMIAAMQAIGWHVADKISPHNAVRQGLSAVLNRPYDTAPMSRLYLFGRKQDISFELALEGKEGGRGNRHHVRFWAVSYGETEQLNFKQIRWHDRNSVRKSKNLLWLGAASCDVGFAVIRHNVQITHMIDANTNAERELIATSLKQANLVKSMQTAQLRKPYWLRNRALGGHLHTDGRLAIITLRKSQV